MNIPFIQRNIQTFFCENVLSSFTLQQKKVAAIALAIFSFLALVYCFIHFYLFKTPSIEPSDSHKIDDIINQEIIRFENENVTVEKQLVIEGLDGKKWTISILLSGTVADLKKKIHEQSGIPIDHQRLIFKRK